MVTITSKGFNKPNSVAGSAGITINNKDVESVTQVDTPNNGHAKNNNSLKWLQQEVCRKWLHYWVVVTTLFSTGKR